MKQEAAMGEVMENRGIPIGKAMRNAGYTKASAKNPKNLTNSKAWKSKLGALAKANNVTIEQYMMNIGLGMKATKQNQYTGEVTEDITTRLSANKQAERFIFKSTEQNEPMNAEELKELAEASDEVAVSMLFKKNG